MKKIVAGLLLAGVLLACATGLAYRQDRLVRLTVVNVSQFDAFRVKVCNGDGSACGIIGRVYSLGAAGPFTFRANPAGNIIELDFIGRGSWYFPLTTFDGESWVLNVASSPGASYFSRPSSAAKDLPQ